MSALHMNHQRDETQTSACELSSLFAGICNYIGLTMIGAVAALIAGCNGKSISRKGGIMLGWVGISLPIPQFCLTILKN